MLCLVDRSNDESKSLVRSITQTQKDRFQILVYGCCAYTGVLVCSHTITYDSYIRTSVVQYVSTSVHYLTFFGQTSNALCKSA